MILNYKYHLPAIQYLTERWFHRRLTTKNTTYNVELSAWLFAGRRAWIWKYRTVTRIKDNTCAHPRTDGSSGPSVLPRRMIDSEFPVELVLFLRQQNARQLPCRSVYLAGWCSAQWKTASRQAMMHGEKTSSDAGEKIKNQTLDKATTYCTVL